MMTKTTAEEVYSQVVKTLADKEYDAGEHSLIWDGRDSQGRATASGVYLYHMVSEGLRDTRKMILLR